MGGVQSQAVSPPYYPAPFGGWVDDWASSYEKAKLLVDNMTLAEKTNITAGTGIYMGEIFFHSFFLSFCLLHCLLHYLMKPTPEISQTHETRLLCCLDPKSPRLNRTRARTKD